MDSNILLELSNQYGCPIYVYDGNKIESQFARLSNAFAGVKHLRINYAVKALSNISILKLFKKFF